MPFRKKLLVAVKARLPGGKKFLVDLSVIESGHRPATEAECAWGSIR